METKSEIVRVPWSISEPRGGLHYNRVVDADGMGVGNIRGKECADFMIAAVNNSKLKVLEQINTLVCYASEENTDAKDEVLALIGAITRKALGIAK